MSMSIRHRSVSAAGAAIVSIGKLKDLPAGVPAPDLSAIEVEPRDPKGRFQKGNRGGLKKRSCVGPTGRTSHRTSHWHYRPFAKFAKRYAFARRLELERCLGGILSVGVISLIESAADCLAQARYFSHKFAKTLQVDFQSRSQRLSETARQHEIAAWELGTREATVRAKLGIDAKGKTLGERLLP